MPKPALFETTEALLQHWQTGRPDKVALRDTERSISYDALEQYTRSLAVYFFELGLKAGDRVAWLGKNSLDYFCLLHACGRTGIVLVPIGWRLAPKEMAWIANDATVQVVFFLVKVLTKLARAFRKSATSGIM